MRKESGCQFKSCRRCRFDTWIRKIPWRRKWQPTPAFLPGISYGLEDPGRLYSPWGHKEWDTTQQLSTQELAPAEPMKSEQGSQPGVVLLIQNWGILEQMWEGCELSRRMGTSEPVHTNLGEPLIKFSEISPAGWFHIDLKVDLTLISKWPWWGCLHHGNEKMITQCCIFLPKSEVTRMKLTQLLGSTRILTDLHVK